MLLLRERAALGQAAYGGLFGLQVFYSWLSCTVWDGRPTDGLSLRCHRRRHRLRGELLLARLSRPRALERARPRARTRPTRHARLADGASAQFEHAILGHVHQPQSQEIVGLHTELRRGIELLVGGDAAHAAERL